jgi:hypothetical protein
MKAAGPDAIPRAKMPSDFGDGPQTTQDGDLMTAGRIQGALLAQVFGQVLTSWTVLVHLTRWPEVSVLVIASLVAAATVPFRHDGSPKDRAAGNFGASLLVVGLLWWEVLMGGIDSIIGGAGFGLGMEGMLMLAATVLFSLAGGLFWTLQREEA